MIPTMKRITAFAILSAMTLEPVSFAGLGSKKAQYVGGTVSLKPETEGYLSTDNTEKLVFKGNKGEAWELQYAKVTSISYGQHAGRRVGATIAWGVTTLGIGALPILFSKKRRHYLTINYTNEQGKEDAAVFQLGKDTTRTTIASIQARTGKKIEYEDDEARKTGNK